eukprot:TRINITY_DN45742_c0_g1_i1.p1 TRINITY_DN45742_c0_g1~~TRINITY_DN45742_c0_g1_i1.p1  ORF type:complete len:650 (+),score=139.48 TRINITY_DN45742_c0_g1_i1:66-2015(+)
MLPELEEYLHLLSYPSLVSRYLFDSSEGWLKVFEAWNVTYTAVSIIVAVVDFFLLVVFSFGFGLIALPWVTMALIGSVISSWLGWYCIVKNGGCCGPIGLIIWGCLFLSSALGEFEYMREQKVDVFILFLDFCKAMPATAMALSCFMAFHRPGEAGILAREVATRAPVQRPKLFAKCVAEFLGTFLLVFTVGCNIVASPSPWAGVSIACVLMVSIYSLAGVSGANFNPAVSLALFLSQSFGGNGIDMTTMVMHSVSQVTGGCVAAVAFKLLFGEGVELAVPAGFSLWQAGGCELIYTCMLCFVVLNVATASKNSGNQYYGLAIAFVIIAGAYGGGAVSLGCFNPAVALGLATSGGGDMHVCLVYFAYEFAGAALAVLLFIGVRGDDFGRKVDQLGAKAMSEFLGTFFLVVTVGLNVLANSPAAAFSIAAALTSMIYALGSASGAHFNPAVSTAILCSGRDKSFSVHTWAVYIIFQVLGGIFGALVYSQLYDEEGLRAHSRGKHHVHQEPSVPASFALGPQGSYLLSQAVTAEAIYTFVLAFVVLSVAVAKKTKSAEMFGLAIGSCVTVGGVAVGAVSGASLNPAVSIGIATTHVVHGGGTMGTALIYSSVELIAGVLASIAFQITHADKGARHYEAVADEAPPPLAEDA